MPVEVVLQQSLELLGVLDVGAGGHQGTTGQLLVKCRVLPPVQLVDWNLPQRPGLLGTVAVAGVRYPTAERFTRGPSYTPRAEARTLFDGVDYDLSDLCYVRYASGRVRVRDPAGNLLEDTG